ncbi:hypothetical protein D6029_06160 [Buttiauxella izardii]|uniref:Uncharacterized protein n=1 Tax=Buttiauxella izardii TaxID=82991 RepID=A0A3A5K6C6_9ENTR|nr:hypothetical protein D6029_06160 [Buttiauxella izardii]
MEWFDQGFTSACYGDHDAGDSPHPSPLPQEREKTMQSPIPLVREKTMQSPIPLAREKTMQSPLPQGEG